MVIKLKRKWEKKILLQSQLHLLGLYLCQSIKVNPTCPCRGTTLNFYSLPLPKHGGERLDPHPHQDRHAGSAPNRGLSSNSSPPCTPVCSQLPQTCKSKHVLYVPLKCFIFIVSLHYTDIVLCRSVKVVEKTPQDGIHLEAAASAPWRLRRKAGLAHWSSRLPPATKPRRRGR